MSGFFQRLSSLQ